MSTDESNRGYTLIPNELIDRINGMSEAELRVMLALVRIFAVLESEFTKPNVIPILWIQKYAKLPERQILDVMSALRRAGWLEFYDDKTAVNIPPKSRGGNTQ